MADPTDFTAGDPAVAAPTNGEAIPAPAADPVPPQADAAIEQRELSTVNLFDGLSKQTLPKLFQFVAVAAVAASSLLGPEMVLAAGAVMLAFEMGRAFMQNRADLNRELALYHKDIAKAVGKSCDAELTITDMRAAADEKIVGDKAIKPLKMGLEHLDYRGKYNYLMGAARALATTVIAFAMKGMLPPAKDITLRTLGTLAMPLSGAMMTVGTATFGIESLGKDYFSKHKPPTVYTELMRLQETAKHQPVSAEQVFSVIVKLDKGLAKDIEEHLGKPYHELTFRNKERVIKATENRAHALALTEAINEGQLPVTAIARSALKEIEWPASAPTQKTESPAPAAEITPEKETAIKSFVAELMNQRRNGGLRLERAP